jgi:hypothetical protein
MWPAAALAHAASALESDAPAELTPMSRIQVAELSPDRHDPQDLAHLNAHGYSIVPHQQLSHAVFAWEPSASAPMITPNLAPLQKPVWSREGLIASLAHA